METPLKKIRAQRNLTTRAVAQSIGVAQSTYSRIENGLLSPSPELANRLAKHFGNAVTRDQILFPEDYADDLSSRKPASVPTLQKAS